ncbi:efflux RND transporter periplasmic adaptor subunit [Hyphomicrobium sp. CS1BSMeth3]|uniref:HlyD family secretion protein n=1 Tax=Hyphomicrobium sp. CS1BSMeth3 TaxID=1892844 RepID=UPI0009F8E2A1|nr:efflux RND transporter periplasmic adaptor subunit [Hyphomicrobium sp. CS1BSMeth3]
MQPHPTTNPSHAMPIGANAPRRGRRIALMMGLFAAGSASVLMVMQTAPKHFVAAIAPASAIPAPAVTDRPQSTWIAAAPGRVEPRSGQVRVSALAPGRVLEVSAATGDRVLKGDVLIRLDDKEARARLAAAEVEVTVRQRERDAQPETAGREDVRKAEDALHAAERSATNARFALDGVLAADRRAPGNPQALIQARNQLTQAEDKLKQERTALAMAHAKSKVPAPNRAEAALIAARAELTLAEEMVEKMRIRAPLTGSVLQVHAKAGELAMPAVEQALVVMGDLTLMRVRAEVDEQDVAKIKTGQQVFVRSTAYPGREFSGTVKELAASLAMPRMGSRGARRATDVEVMEVMVDLEGTSPLLPGMRADVFFR